MEQIVVGILMLLAFCLGAYIRQPINIIKHKENETKPASKEEVEDDAESKRLEKERQKQLEAMYNYSEKDALNEKD